MSRIFRSIDSRVSQARSVDLAATQLSGYYVERPAGGFMRPPEPEPEPEEPQPSLIEQCEEEARRLVEEARREAEAIQREAWQTGFEEGERAGNKLAMQKLEPALQTVNGLIQSLVEAREAVIREHESELIKVAFLIASRVLHRQLEMQPETVADVVREAIGRVPKTESVQVLVSPHDLPLLEQMLRETGSGFTIPERAELRADESVQRGGCRVVTQAGDIDATVETQLRTILEALW